MIRRISSLPEFLLDRYGVICGFLAFFILTLTGVGDLRIVSMTGILLCAVGFARRGAKVDLWVFLPLLIYAAAGMASSYAAYGNITEGYGGLHLIFPVLYLLMACLDGRELLLLKRLSAAWTGVLASAGVVTYVYGAVSASLAGRLKGLLGNPNATGIFLVMGWFALQSCLAEQAGKREEQAGRRRRGKRDGWAEEYMEPVLLAALALTLSMGSFAAMAAGVLVLAMSERKKGGRETVRYVCRLLAKAVLGVGTGLLLYLGATRTNAQWICMFLLLYEGVLVLCWKELENFLRVHSRTAACIAAAGVLVAGAVIAVRPGSFATFSERLDMMKAALPYLTVNPLFGVGPYRWRLLDMQDGGTYFGTWHIHNVLLHAGVEFGWVAAAMLLIPAVRFYRKNGKNTKKGKNAKNGRNRKYGQSETDRTNETDGYVNAPAKAGFTAYCLHNMMDTSFFYLGITALAIIMAGEPQNRGKQIGSAGVKVLFGLLAAMHGVCFVCYMMTV